MLKISIGAVLALTVSNAIADNVFIYEDNNRPASNAVAKKVQIYKNKNGQALLTNRNPSGNLYKTTEKVITFRDKDGSLVTRIGTFVDSPYAALR